MSAGPIVALAGTAAAAIAALAGLVTLATPALRLKKQVDALKRLPVFAVVRDTRARVQQTQRHAQALVRERQRVRIALARLRDARDRVSRLATSLVSVIRRDGVTLLLPPPRA